MSEPPRDLVISVHGIRTRGVWQKTLDSVLADHSFRTRPYDYGYFDLVRFAIPASRARQVERFYDFYHGVLAEARPAGAAGAWRPSVVAHSMGSYIVGKCMQKHPEVAFDKVILCGSILPPDFDWETLFLRDQVNRVQNEYGRKDVWAGVVGWVIGDAGPSGSCGFDFTGTRFTQQRFEFFTHSDFFHRGHIEAHWLPVLRRASRGFVVRNGRELDDPEEFVRLLDLTHEIDLECFAALPGYDVVDIPRGLSTTWIGINADIYTFLMRPEGDAPAGYINAMPLTDDAFERVRAGNLNDNEIRSADVLPFHGPARVRMYLMSIAVAAGARRGGDGLFQEGLEKLLHGFTSKLIWHARNNRVRVTELLAVGWTPEGVRLCRMLGMADCGRDPSGYPIFSLRLGEAGQPVPKATPWVRGLLKAYAELDAQGGWDQGEPELPVPR